MQPKGRGRRGRGMGEERWWRERRQGSRPKLGILMHDCPCKSTHTTRFPSQVHRRKYERMDRNLVHFMTQVKRINKDNLLTYINNNEINLFMWYSD